MMNGDRLRLATVDDREQLLRLWVHLFETQTGEQERWYVPASEWFTRLVDDHANAHLPVIERDGTVISTAIGTLELGVPNPYCIRGRTVRLANVFTLSAHRESGYATRLVRDVIRWARSIEADRVDLSATPQGQTLYEQVGFTSTTAPRMKLVL